MKQMLLSIIIICILAISIKGDNIIIPAEAIRFRIIANSNEYEDQSIKINIKNKLEEEMYNFLKTSNNLHDAKQRLNNNIENINEIIAETLLLNNIQYSFNTKLGMNYFPKKEYKGITYEQGEYESLVVTLGEGKGENWWCVLFPPLCLLEAEENDTNEVEYKSYVKEIIDKFMK